MQNGHGGEFRRRVPW